jgi:SAM-dependent methyltransferase
MTKMNNTHLHDGKAVFYDEYRPAYSELSLKYIVNTYNLGSETVADVGCGTGIFTRELSPLVKFIYAVEPNADMRNVCNEKSRSFANIAVIDGAAENTTLEDQSVDFITVATAFHWFDFEKFRQECRRILRPGGLVSLIINSPGSRNPIDVYAIRNLCQNLGLNFFDDLYNPLVGLKLYYEFFADGKFDFQKFKNDLNLNRDEFIGRNLSMHHAPKEKDTQYQAYVDGLNRIFDEMQADDRIIVHNDTIMAIGDV